MKQLLALACVLAAACGSKSQPATDTTTTTTTPTSAGPMTPEKWEGMDLEARGGYMKEVVLPAMTAVLKEFPDEFGNEEINCATCHGSGVEQGQFEMPNAELPVLTAAMVQNPDADHQAITDFMKQRVTPEMAKLLGRAPWSPETPEGFGCGGCHTFAQ